MAQVTDPQTRRWLEREAQAIADEETDGVLFLAPVHRDLLARWRKDAPEATARLRQAKVLKAAAIVLWDRFRKTEAANLQAGMAPTDAREDAESAWLTLSETSPLPPQDALITS